ncbi:precursor of CEP7-like [Mangifera indica]|uniref:precursor of CEP7-like n=1 Tax=Mangifera indica TaxID=29780 RepID=UPI001CFA6F4F|nr:precursor of CEP7-like [Mangifera indica]
MAKTRTVVACFFILVLILSHEFTCIEGRHLKSRLCKKCSKHADNTLGVAKGKATESRQEQASKVEYVDDFRPTTPGHSPGVGHSINN